MRPLLLRPPDFLRGSVRARSGPFLERSEKSSVVMKRRPGDVGLYCLSAIVPRPYACSKNSTIFSPFFRTTKAFFQSGRRPTWRPCRFTLPCTFATRTSATFAPNSVSTAFLISGLVASRWTSKHERALRFLEERRLLGEERPADDVVEVLHRYSRTASASRSSSLSIASWVTTRCLQSSTS